VSMNGRGNPGVSPTPLIPVGWKRFRRYATCDCGDDYSRADVVITLVHYVWVSPIIFSFINGFFEWI